MSVDWYLTVRRARAVLLSAIVLSAVVVILGSRELPIPNLGSGVALTLPLAYLLPAVQGALVVGSIGEPPYAAEQVAVRAPAILDALLIVALLAAVALPLVVVGLLVDDALLLAAVRNLLGFVGAGLLARPVVGGRGAAVVPVVVSVLLAAFAGADRGALWAWPMHPASSLPATVVAVTMLCAGMFVAHRCRGPRVR